MYLEFIQTVIKLTVLDIPNQKCVEFWMVHKIQVPDSYTIIIYLLNKLHDDY